MSAKTEIAWTDSTWNPVRGCTKVSAGCKHCYAERFAERFRGVPGHPFEQGFDVRLVPEALDLPLHWRKPRRIFVNSMSDLFHESVPDEFIDRVFKVMQTARQHTYQVLTKRPERMAKFLSGRVSVPWGTGPFPDMARHIWLGVSVEDQRAADERIPHLLATPAAVRFLSCEPLLSHVHLRPSAKRHEDLTPWLGAGRISWVIIGGESGPSARPCDLTWIRSLAEQCKAAQIPAFVKQLGAQPRGECPTRLSPASGGGHPAPEWLDEDGVYPSVSGKPAADLCHAFDDSWWPCKPRLLSRKGGDPSEWPEDLRVRQVPEVAP